nr:DUF6550 family protein [uncultured Acetatifactor sp.]
MNKNYKNKKRAAIIILSVLAVCLAVCLVWHMGTMGKTELPVVEPEVPEMETIVTVPRIDAGGTVEPEKETEPGQGAEPGTGQDGAQSETEEPSAGEGSGEGIAAAPAETQPARTDGKPQSPKDAVPPSEPPAETGSTAAVENPDEDGNCQPEHTQPQEDQPQGGDTNPAGAVYVPGFGYIESSGPNEQGTSHTDGDWDKQIGTM